MFFWRQAERPRGGIYDWLRENRQQVLAGTADYRGTRVCDTTEFRQYKIVVSAVFATVEIWSEHDIPTPENGHLRSSAWFYSFISLLCGWWCFPWGPLFTLHAVAFNLLGGRQRTAASLLQLVEWGWDAPADASISAHQKKLVTVSAAALAEIRARRIAGEFDESLAVRIIPLGKRSGEARIAFDYPVSDGNEWIDSSQGVLLLVGKEHEFAIGNQT